MQRSKVGVPADVMEGLETIRLSGKTNMFDVPVVIHLALDMGLTETAFWVEENQSLYVSGIFSGFEVEGGETRCADR